MKTVRVRGALTLLTGGLLLTRSTLVSASPTEPGTLENPLESPVACITCHTFNNIEPHVGEPPYAPWYATGTLMANSARDPVFWAGVALAAQDSPEHTEDCIRCHSPRAFLNGNGAATAIDELTPQELEGISCDFCHRSMWDGETPAGNARFELDDVVDPTTNSVPKRGPWAYGPGEHLAHPAIQETDFLGSSRFCGTCHDVTTHRERVDERGVGMGFDFNEQRTYSEWLNSDFADPSRESSASCQDCHMPALEDAAGCVDFNNPDNLHPTGARRHELVGANRFVLEILREDYGTPSPTDPFQVAIDNLDAFLPTAATLEVSFPEALDLAAGVTGWSARVTNDSGHKLPTGYSEGRVMWLEVSARYDGELIYSSGLWQPETLSIQDDAQARRYEGIAEDADDGTQLHLLRNNRWVRDTRIPPKGLKPDVQTDPVNAPYELQPDGTWPHFDEVNYDFAPTEIVEHEGAEPLVELSVRLLYLINTDEYVSTLVDDNVTNSAGLDLATRFQQAGNPQPLVIAEDSVTIPLVGLTPLGGSEESTESTESSESEGSGESTGSSSTSTETSETSDVETEGASQDDESTAGCACRAEPHSPPSGAWLALVGLWGWRRRRA